MEHDPHVGGKGSHGGYCGPAVKPIALHMVADCARNPEVDVPISGIGGISTWRDAVEFMLMGATGVQVCTAAMHHGFRIVEDMIDGLNNYLDEKGLSQCHRIDREIRSALLGLGEFGSELCGRRANRHGYLYQLQQMPYCLRRYLASMY